MAAAEVEIFDEGDVEDDGVLDGASLTGEELWEKAEDEDEERKEALRGPQRRGVVEEEDMHGEPVLSVEEAVRAANNVLNSEDEALMDAVVKRLVYGLAAAREAAVGAIDFEKYEVQVFGYYPTSTGDFEDMENLDAPDRKGPGEVRYLSAEDCHEPPVNLSFLIKLNQKEEDGGLSRDQSRDQLTGIMMMARRAASALLSFLTKLNQKEEDGGLSRDQLRDQLTGIMMTARKVVSALRIAGVPAQAEFRCPGYIRAQVPLRRFLELVDDCRKAGSVEEASAEQPKAEEKRIVVATADRTRRRAMDEVEAL